MQPDLSWNAALIRRNCMRIWPVESWQAGNRKMLLNYYETIIVLADSIIMLSSMDILIILENQTRTTGTTTFI